MKIPEEALERASVKGIPLKPGTMKGLSRLEGASAVAKRFSLRQSGDTSCF